MALEELEEKGRGRKTVLYVAAAVVLVAAGGAFAFLRQSKPAAPRFETTSVDRGPVVARVTATGIVSALVTVQVGSQVSGRIAEIHADFNSSVKKGELIARIDPQIFEAQLEQARANSLAAQASLTRAKVQALDASRQAARSTQLRAQNLIAQADLDTSQANADAAKAGVDAAQATLAQTRAALRLAEVNLQYTKIIAPINGTVISRAVELGQTVASALQAPTLFTIAEDLRRMQVDTSVAEADVGKLEAGQSATFIVDAFPTERFKGTIRQIRNAATTTQNVVTYDAVIDVENPDLKLRPGMTANVTVVYAQKQDTLRVPNAALRFKPSRELLGDTPSATPSRSESPTLASAARTDSRGQGGAGDAGHPSDRSRGRATDSKTVYVLKEGKPSALRVKVGVTDGTNTEVTEGELHEGDVVITAATSEGAGSAPSQPRPLGMGGAPSRGGRSGHRGPGL